MASETKSSKRFPMVKSSPKTLVTETEMLPATQSTQTCKERKDEKDVSAHRHPSSLSSTMPPAKVSIAESVSSASSIASEASESCYKSKEQSSEALTCLDHLPTNAPQDSNSQSKRSSTESSTRTKSIANLASTENRKRSYQDLKDSTLASSSLNNINDDKLPPVFGLGHALQQQQQQPETASRTHDDIIRTDSAVSESSSSNKRLCTLLPDTLLEALVKQQKQIVEPNTTVLLAQPHDETVLNPLHVFVRQQVEVFTATQVDLSQPAPGRKNPILLHQVGLRCIHCKNLQPRDRVKRAVCFPTSVGRVYHSVSDMKFDHFSRCKGLPANLQEQFKELKANSKRKKQKSDKTKTGSFSSTAQYYHDSARKMGMVDANGGVFLTSKLPTFSGQHLGSSVASSDNANSSNNFPIVVMPLLIHPGGQTLRLPDAFLHTASSLGQSSQLSSLLPSLYRQQPPPPLPSQMFYPLQSSQASTNNESSSAARDPSPDQQQENQSETKTGPFKPSLTASDTNSLSLLASPLDAEHLNDIHCFVRKHVQVFEATRSDLNAPAPGRRNRIVLGQVGIRCIHCKQHNQMRVKRSVCYPPSIHGIYHAVSNMKFDHFGICKSLPADARAEFTRLRNGSVPRSKRKAKSSANSMAKYYVESAKRLGLVDTEDGIRFQSSLHRADSNGAESPPMASDASHVSDGMSALMMAATDPQLRAAYNHKKLQEKQQQQQLQQESV